MAGVFYSPKAIADIERIRDYIRDALLNPEAADRIVCAIFDAGDTLAKNPRPGARFRSDLELLKYYRYLPVERCMLVFRVQNDRVGVVRVLHELQDSISILLRDVKESGGGSL